MYAKIETERLLYIRLNQTELRSEQYIHLRDAIVNDGNVNPNEMGRMAILPSTFTGSPRHMHEYAQDAMTYVRAYGRQICSSPLHAIQHGMKLKNFY
ncbi:helitron_like_N domain-containing protein [Trichonephila clavipes]|nr:helitron_like_N domain-containing protein [Trichonephila clavipes]